MMTLTINPIKEAETITEILKDESPLVNWLVEWDDSLMGFRIRAGIIVKDVPIGAMYLLPIDVHLKRDWLADVRGRIAHLIANQLLAKPGK